MFVENIFEKDIRRSINGVVKADDESQLYTELYEYVLTDEAAARLEGFLEDYNQNRSNGAWLSGFFGSGKSHLLKMMAVVLENREVNGEKAIDLFLPKCDRNPMLRGLLEKAVCAPSRSILFNIDQKADTINKTDSDAILSVFLKVFNEFCGYYSHKAYVAQFERELDEDGLLGRFKDEFRSASGKDWDSHGAARDTRYSKEIDAAYSRTTGSDRTGIIDAYRKEFRLSIEGFANLVNDYIKRQPSGFRLNFFVDEVGQFVANNTKLMLNLQTISETLNTVCKNRSWLIVTSQVDLSNVVGEMDCGHGNDFTRIEARFKTKLPLSGANADEVIKRRLLEKTASAIPGIASLYAGRKDDFNVLFNFADGSKSYALYRDEEAFVSTYPFVPYQFDLFHTTMLNLSTHEAFTGRYTAVAERSMLAVCQDAAKRLCDEKSAVGALVPFDYWFDGIRVSLKPQQINQIVVAERNLGNPFAVRILKALYLVKYVREFKATVRNLCVLMTERLDEDVSVLAKNIESTLQMLENESYVQRVGACYEYLTDEEKDLDKEIKATDISQFNIDEEFQRVVFQSILKQGKMQCANGSIYPFAKAVDDRLLGKDADLTINVITPNHHSFGRLPDIKMQKLGKPELTIALPAAVHLLQDIILHKRTESYLKQNPAVSQEGMRRRLLESRVEANRQLETRIEEEMRQKLSEAAMLVSGEEVQIAATEAVARISEGFEQLAARVYSSRKMIEGLDGCSEGDIPKYLNNDPQLPLGEEESEAEREIMTVLRGNQARGQRTTMQMLVEKFERPPYGWQLKAIECLTAKLWGTGRILLESGGVAVEKPNVRAAITNTRNYPTLIVRIEQEVSQTDIHAVKTFVQDFFSAPVPCSDAKGVAEFAKRKMAEFSRELADLARENPYPFVRVLETWSAKIREISAKPGEALYSEDFRMRMDELLDAKDDTIDPVCGILKGAQLPVYQNALKLVESNRLNLVHIDGNEPETLKTLISAESIHTGGKLMQMKALYESLSAKLKRLIDDERAKALGRIDELDGQCKELDVYKTASEESRKKADGVFEEAKKRILAANVVSVMRDEAHNCGTSSYSEVLAMLSAVEGAPKKKYVQAYAITVKRPKGTLESENDIEEYLSSVREAFKAELAKGNHILV